MIDRNVFVAAFLVALGCLQMAGDLSGNSNLKGLGLATVASPAPKVFTAQKGFETYANRFFVEYHDNENQYQSIQITSRNYQKLEGPYNRRNMYGAVTSYGPVLIANPITRPMFDSVFRYAFCGDAPLLKEIGISNIQTGSPVYVRLEPTGHNREPDKWTLKFQAPCDE